MPDMAIMIITVIVRPTNFFNLSISFISGYFGRKLQGSGSYLSKRLPGGIRTTLSTGLESRSARKTRKTNLIYGRVWLASCMRPKVIFMVDESPCDPLSTAAGN